MATMKAVRFHEYGGPDVLRFEDAPRPDPAADEVLIRVHASGVNPVDWKIRAGRARRWRSYNLPLIPGWDVSGVVEAVGSEAKRLKPGDEVYSRPDLTRNGSYAEYIVVRESEVALKPKSMDHVVAAAIPLAGLTAWQALFDGDRLQSGQTILIHAAAGGVGSFAVQMAKLRGARVIGTASPRNHEFLKSLGADEVVDYNRVKFEDAVHDVDMVLDTMGSHDDIQDRSWKVLRPGGILVGILDMPSDEKAAEHGVRKAHVLVRADVPQLEEIAKLADAGKIKPVIQAVLPLAEARQAQEMSATGHTRGKIVLRVV